MNNWETENQKSILEGPAANDNVSQDISVTEVDEMVSRFAESFCLNSINKEEEVVDMDYDYFGDQLSASLLIQFDYKKNSQICWEILRGNLKRVPEIVYLPLSVARKAVEMANSRMQDLDFVNLSFLNEELAAILADCNQNLALPYVETLDLPMVHAFAKHQGGSLDLKGAVLDYEQAIELTKHQGVALSLGLPGDLKIAKILSAYQKLIVITIEAGQRQDIETLKPLIKRRGHFGLEARFSPEDFETLITALLEHRGPLYLDLPGIPANLITRLVKHDGPVAFLEPVKLSPINVRILKKTGFNVNLVKDGIYKLWVE